jgi:hypothetical protein
MTNEQVFLNPQMPQIDADGESDKRTHLVVEAPSRARASGQTGGWHNRLHKGTKGLLGLQSASSVSSADSSNNRRQFEAQLR